MDRRNCILIKGWNFALEGERSWALQEESDWFIWHEGNLYKKSYTHLLLKCVIPDEGDSILREIHEGNYNNH